MNSAFPDPLGPAKIIQVFEPAMCCPTGVCRPAVDPKLARFAADLDWLRKSGVAVERFSLSQPAAFAQNATVRGTLEKEGLDCLPLIVADGQVVSRSAYPLREVLASFVGLKAAPSIFSDADVPLGRLRLRRPVVAETSRRAERARRGPW